MCSPLRKDEKSKHILEGGSASYKTMGSVENLSLVVSLRTVANPPA